MAGGDIDRTAISEAFSKIKEDMLKLNKELYEMKQKQKRLIEENIKLKQQQNMLTNQPNQSDIDPILISQIVKETLKHSKKNNSSLSRRINKKRKNIIKTRICNLASQKNLSLAEIKDIIVENEVLCSKATFYRYVNKLKSQGMIESMKINDIEVLVKI